MPSTREFLHDKEVVVPPDNDSPGQRHAHDICRSLAGIARTVKIVSLPDAKDATDWIEQGCTLEELIRLVEQDDSIPGPRLELNDIGGCSQSFRPLDGISRRGFRDCDTCHGCCESAGR